MPRELALLATTASAIAYLSAYRLSAAVAGPSHGRALRLFRRWCRRSVRRLGIDVRVDGRPPEGRCVFVANHRSYLDVLVLAEALGATFLSRADVADWSLVGPTARAIGAVFVDREDAHSRFRAARALLRRLRTGSVVVFPEGTTTGAALPGPFEPGLFHLLARSDARLVPVTLRYSRRDAYWIEDIDLRTHLRTRVVGGPPLVATVHVGQVLAHAAGDGECLRDAVYRAVAAPIEAGGELVPVAPA